MHGRLKSIFDEFTLAREAWNKAFALIERSGLDLNRVYSTLDDGSLYDINERIVAICEVALALHPKREGDRGPLVLIPRQPTVVGHLAVAKASSMGLQNTLEPNLQPDTKTTDVNGNLTVAFERAGAATQADLMPLLRECMNAFDGAYNTVAGAMLYGAITGTDGDLIPRARALQELEAEARKAADGGKAAFDETRKLREASSAERDQVQAALTEAQAAHQKIAATQTQAGNDLAEVQAKVAQVREVATAAETLRTTVTTFQSHFDAFQSQLDAKNSSLRKFEEDSVAAMAENKKRGSEIDRLTQKADSMIKGATTAGLSQSLDETRRQYENQMNWAGLKFVGSILFLFICALPLAAHLMPGLVPETWRAFMGVATPNADSSPFALLGRIILLLPATWLAAFYARSHAELFHLHREYAHKAAMAKSIEGFKREAPKYEQEITTAVFLEIRENPGTRKSPEAAQPTNPFVEEVYKKFREVLPWKSGT